jgi:sugar-phosphatase
VVRAILFDLDGTLVDSERSYAEALARALRAEQAVDIAQPERDFIVGRSWVEIHAHLRRVHPQISWDRDEMVAATVAAAEQVLAEVGLAVLPGAAAAVRRFAHLRRGLVTGSAPEEARRALAELGLAGEFEVMITCNDVVAGKPAPEGYRKAAAALGLRCDECLVVEDSVSGIAAGVAAGCRVIAVRAGNFGGHDQSAAHHIIDTLDDLTPELVAGLLR